MADKTADRKDDASLALSPRMAPLKGTFMPTNIVADDSKYLSLPDWIKSRGGTKVIQKILIANNGIAAVKAIRSMRKWSYETFGSDKVFEFIVMTTPEDMKANAQYIHLADNFIQVPAGPSINNFGNVELIVECAERVGAHAVWAGWGHASEKPQLPDSLKKTKTNIVWIGPPSSAMRALGDKIGSSLIAQAAGVPCVAWSGTGLDVKYDKENGIPQDIYDRACVFDAKQAEAAAEKIGFPVMIKASEGGGGKGIRRVEKKEQVEAALRQVQSEVSGPVFVMRVASACRHLEVQLLADEWGNAIAVFGRDCSIQRRHQKIIEEGPVVAAPPEIWREMERSAVRLAKEVGYCGVGTVEYLYAPNGEYYFLELNPRLQVEHPVTELISGVNLPACQLQVAMGIPLHRIPSIRRMYGHSVEEHAPIDFDNTPSKPLPGHVIACRITAENPDVEFQPTSGLIHELNFRSTPNVWGYFSVAAFGGVHEYADSQFGHLFALGETRDEARRNMVSALAELSIRGDIRTTVEYLRKLIEMEDFRRNQVDTMWLERVLARRQVERERPPPHLASLLGALFRAYKLSSTRLRDYVSSLERGQLPSASLNTDITDISLELIYEQTKYRFRVTKSGPNSFDLSIGTSWMVSADVHTLSDGGILVLLNGRKHVVYGQEFPSGLRLTVDGQTCLFREEYDPSSLRAAVQGKLVRFVVADGSHVNKDQAYAEVEVMKMIITLVAPEAGIIRLAKPEGAILEAGDLIAGLTLDDPHRVRKAELFNGTFPSMRTPSPASQKVHVQLKEVLAKIRMVLDGYLAGPGAAKASLTRLLECLRDPQLPLMQFKERMSTLSGRMPTSLYDTLTSIGGQYATNLARDRFPWESREAFPVADLQEAIDSEALKLPKADRATMAMHLTDLTILLAQYKDGNPSYAAQTLTDLLTDYYQVEQYFNDGRQPETVIKQLRKEKKDDLSSVMRVVRAHHQLLPRTELVMNILTTIELQLAPLVPNFLPVLKQLSSLNGRDLSLVVLKARQLIMRHELPSSTQRRIATQTILNSAALSGEASERLARLAPLIDQSQPIEDMIFSFFDEQKPVVLKTAMEVYIRRVYQAYAIPLLSVDYSAELGMLIGAWEFHAQKNVDESVRGLGLAKSDSVVDIEKLAATERPGHGGPSRTPSAAASLSGRTSPPRKDSSPLLAAAATPARTVSGDRATPSEGRSRVASMDPAISHHNRLGVFAHFRDYDAMKKGFSAVARKFEAEAELFTEPVHVLYLGFRWTGVLPSDDTASQYFHTFLKSNEEKITALGIRRVTFIVHTKAEEYPGYYTYRHRFGYSEDTNVRHIEPSYALHLQLQRMSNFDFRYVPSTNRLVHIFSATPLATAATPAAPAKAGKEVKDGKSLPGAVTDALSPVATHAAAPVKPSAAAPTVKRFFVRALVRKLDSATLFAESELSDDKELDSHPETEYAFVEALNALEMAVKGDKSWRYNSIFLNVLVEATMPLRYVENIVRLLARRYSEKVRRLNVSMVEFTISLRTSPSQVKATTYHFVCTNPTGYVLNVDTYAQVRESGSKQVTFRQVRPSDGSRIGEAKGESKTNEVKGYWDGQDVYAPYPVSELYQRQRAAAEAADTVYVYDFPVLIERAIRATWLRTSRIATKSGSPQLKPTSSRSKLEDANLPESVLKVVELVLSPSASSPIGYELVEVSRPNGRNDIGMVAWKLTLNTPEYPRGRDVVLIANDISFMAGSFGPKEDYLFLLASQYARRRRIPRLYFTANSGARIGLADEVKPKFKIAWNNNDPFRGLAYLYLTEADYASLKDTVQATRVDADVDGKIEVRYQLTDVIGRKDGLNMENLRGSGMIAGETSQAYDETFTLTFVTARTVGIGAYLARLGQRVIQKQTPPIILTGYMALNKLLGRSVYTSNLQLGGPDIMYTNGVTHWTVDNDMEGILAVLRWLSYVPIAREESLPLTPSFASVDPVDRKIAFKPTKLAYDPRGFLDGVLDDSKGESRWTGGFFDRDSWQELLGGWAREVVVGRARLGGIPMGVVAVETRTVEATVPADPAVNESKENILQRAGQVWFPASAFKTAQAIKDIVAEDLPLIVFANWRGFSGGMSDMFHEVLKYGAYIVDALRAVKQPVFVYIPPYGTLRGGAWVVVDPTINEQYMEMYADEQARGGVLEPEGTVEVMFKERDMIDTMHRLDQKLIDLDAEVKRLGDVRNPSADESRARLRADIKAREKALLPLYHQAATQFADLHDTPGRMQRKGVIRSPVKWENARSYFYWRLRRRLAETAIVRRIKAADSQYASEEGWRAANTLLQSWLASEATTSGIAAGVRVLEDDRATVEWLETHNTWVEQRLTSLRSVALLREVSRLLDVGTSAAARAPSTVAVPVLAELIKGLDGKQKQELGAALGIKLAA